MLAAGDFNLDEGTVKLIGGAAVALIWVVSQVLNKATKKSPTQAPPPMPQRRVETPVDWPRTPPPRGPMVRQPRGQSPPLRNTAPPMQRRPATIRPQPPVARPPQISPPYITAPQVSEPQYARQSLKPRADEPTAVITPRRIGVAATLLQPQNLKAAFILTEILRPPVALRDPQAESLPQ